MDGGDSGNQRARSVNFFYFIRASRRITLSQRCFQFTQIQINAEYCGTHFLIEIVSPLWTASFTISVNVVDDTADNENKTETK